MKELTCDLCQGTDLILNGGIFDCQTCGTKYSKEDAKKMMTDEAGGLAVTTPTETTKTVATTQPIKTTSSGTPSVVFIDKALQCKECGANFVFTAGEQEFFKERSFTDEPQRCKPCRDARKAAASEPREFYTAVCTSCGGEVKLPYEPKKDRPVYCADCFEKQRNAPKKQSCLLHIVLLLFTFGIGNIIYFIWAKNQKPKA